MKAKEYYAKYHARIMADDFSKDGYDFTTEEGKQKFMDECSASIDKAISDMFIEMVQETQKILNDRKCKKNEAVVGVIREMNDKWNAMLPMYERDYKGYCPLKRNAVINHWCREMPELLHYFPNANVGK